MNTTLSRRGLLLGAGAAAALPILSSCARLSGTSDTSGGGGGGGGGGTVKWAQFYTRLTGIQADANRKWLTTVTTAFEKENPGWKVELEGYQWDQIDQRLVLDLRANVPHDVSLTSPQLMAQHAQAGSLLDLSPYVKKWDAKERDDFVWSPVWKSGELDGKQLGIPLGTHTRGLAYRPATLEKAGLDSVTTPDQLLQLAKTAKADGQPGLLIYLGPDRASIELAFAPLVWHFGGDIFDASAKQATFTTDPVVEAVTWLRELVHVHKVTPASAYAPTAASDDVLMKQFLGTKAGASWGFGTYWIQALNDAKLIKDCYPAAPECAPGEADIVATPTKDQAMFTNSWMISIGAQSKQADMAWKLIEVMLRPEHLRTYPDAGLPIRLSEYDRPEYATPFYQKWQQIAEKGRGMPATPYYAQLADTVAAALQAAIGSPTATAADVKTTLARHEDEWNSKHGGK